MGLAYQTVVIASGASLSGVFSVERGEIVGIEMDQVGWDAAGFSFARLMADSTFQKVVDEAGAEVTLAAVTAGNVYMAVKESAKALRGLGQVKLRSGTAGVPVAQSATRTLKVVIQLDND